MNKIKRLDAVLKGKKPDRAPFCMWYHFGSQHASGKKAAAITLEWFEHYDFDFLKVMNDYYYPMPEGKDELRTAEDLALLKRFEKVTLAAGASTTVDFTLDISDLVYYGIDENTAVYDTGAFIVSVGGLSARFTLV